MPSANEHLLLLNVSLNAVSKIVSADIFHLPPVKNENKKLCLGGKKKKKEKALHIFADLNKPCLFLFSSSSEEHESVPML